MPIGPICPICFLTVQTPVALRACGTFPPSDLPAWVPVLFMAYASGHVFCKTCVTDYVSFRPQNGCPICRAVPSAKPVPGNMLGIYLHMEEDPPPPKTLDKAIGTSPTLRKPSSPDPRPVTPPPQPEDIHLLFRIHAVPLAVQRRTIDPSILLGPRFFTPSIVKHQLAMVQGPPPPVFSLKHVQLLHNRIEALLLATEETEKTSRLTMEKQYVMEQEYLEEIQNIRAELVHQSREHNEQKQDMRLKLEAQAKVHCQKVESLNSALCIARLETTVAKAQHDDLFASIEPDKIELEKTRTSLSGLIDEKEALIDRLAEMDEVLGLAFAMNHGAQVELSSITKDLMSESKARADEKEQREALRDWVRAMKARQQELEAEYMVESLFPLSFSLANTCQIGTSPAWSR